MIIFSFYHMFTITQLLKVLWEMHSMTEYLIQEEVMCWYVPWSFSQGKNRSLIRLLSTLYTYYMARFSLRFHNCFCTDKVFVCRRLVRLTNVFSCWRIPLRSLSDFQLWTRNWVWQNRINTLLFNWNPKIQDTLHCIRQNDKLFFCPDFLHSGMAEI